MCLPLPSRPPLAFFGRKTQAIPLLFCSKDLLLYNFEMLSQNVYSYHAQFFFQLKTVQHKLAELKTHICVTRAFVDNCLQLHEAKRLDSASASMAKYWYACYSN
jgi:hypothetical protein